MARNYLFYSALWYGRNTMRIGIAKSDASGGPYVDLKNEPLFDLGYAAINAQRVDSILICPLSYAAGTGKLLPNETIKFPVDFDQMEYLPGSFVSCSFESMDVTTLWLEMTNANAIAEILAIG